MKVSGGAVMLIAVMAVLCLLSVYTSYSNITTNLFSTFSVWRKSPVTEWEEKSGPVVSVWRPPLPHSSTTTPSQGSNVSMATDVSKLGPTRPPVLRHNGARQRGGSLASSLRTSAAGREEAAPGPTRSVPALGKSVVSSPARNHAPDLPPAAGHDPSPHSVRPPTARDRPTRRPSSTGDGQIPHTPAEVGTTPSPGETEGGVNNMPHDARPAASAQLSRTHFSAKTTESTTLPDTRTKMSTNFSSIASATNPQPEELVTTARSAGMSTNRLPTETSTNPRPARANMSTHHPPAQGAVSPVSGPPSTKGPPGQFSAVRSGQRGALTGSSSQPVVPTHPVPVVVSDGNAHNMSSSGRFADTDTSTYPAWWSEAWPRSAVWERRSRFVGDRPLFDTCLTANLTWPAYPFVEPEDYLNTSKNPCWYADPVRKRQLRCVPYFYLAGVAKGGTTDLAKRLRLHPHVFAGTLKEYHWWERLRFGDYDEEEDEISIDMEGGMSFKEYTDKITGSDIEDLQYELRHSGSSVRIFGDYSPSYLWDPRNWCVLEGNQNCSEPRLIVGQHIRHVFPQAKVILTFRHPTPRLYSRFASRTTRTDFLRRATAKDFHTYVLEGIQIYRRCFAQWSIRQCAYNATIYHESVVRLVEGMYPVFMADWLRVWPRDQMLLLRYEDYGGHEGQRLAEVFHFLGLAPLSSEAMADLLAFDPVNSGSDTYHRMGSMLPETREALDAFYQPFIQQFAHMVRDQRFLWTDVPH